MGKSKKRIFNKNKDESGTVLKRNEAIEKVLCAIKMRKINEDTEKLISLFGISIEELFEAGAAYEEISALKHLFI